MKKIFTLLVLLLTTLATQAEERELTVASGSTALPMTLKSDWSVYTYFPTTEFADAQAGDVLTVYVSNVNEGAQISLKDMSDGWPALEESTAYPSVATTATTFTYTFTAETIAKVKNNNLVIGGKLLTVDRVTLTLNGGTSTAGETYTAWTGEKVFISTWKEWLQVPASAFAKAEKGMLLRFRFKDVKAGAQFKLSTSSWTNMPGAEEVASINGVYQQYTITEAMLAELKANGGIISGTSFTLTSIEVINPDDLKPLTLSVPVTNDWVFTNTAPSFTIHAVNPYAETVTANCVIAITTDKMEPVTTLAQEVKLDGNATKDIAMTCTEELPAGIYKATATVNDDLARGFFFAVKPTEIVSATDKQSDFESYWAAAKEQLKAIPMNAQLTEITAKSTDNRKVYLVELQSVPDGLTGDPVTVRGYYCEPTDGKKHPVIMHYQGYDSFEYGPGGTAPAVYIPSGDDNPDYAEFTLSTRGQSINNREPYLSQGGNPYGQNGWFKANFGNKDSYYYRGAYMDCVRAIDFVASRETSDMNNLYAEGQSQGGALTIAAAALSGRTFRAIAPAITFMGDFPDYFQLAGWPASDANAVRGTMTDEEMYAFLSYYDTKNLATMISCPVITSIGLQDNVCPPHTNLAPYNNLQGTDKQIVFNPELYHQVANSWYSTYMAFFKARQQTTGIDDALLNDKGEMTKDEVIYDLQGRRVANPTKGLYVVNGKKVMLK